MKRLGSMKLHFLMVVATSVLAMFIAAGCATTCDESCDGELERDFCETCAEGPVLEKDCVELYCE